MAKQKSVIFTCIGYKADRTKVNEARIEVGGDEPPRVLEHKIFLSEDERKKYNKMLGVLMNERLNEVYPGGEGYETGNT